MGNLPGARRRSRAAAWPGNPAAAGGKNLAVAVGRILAAHWRQEPRGRCTDASWRPLEGRNGTGPADAVDSFTVPILHGANLAGDPTRNRADIGIDAKLVQPPTTFAKTDDPGLDISAHPIGHDQRPAAIALTGTPATLAKAGADHPIGDGAAVGTETVADVVGDKLHRHLPRDIGDRSTLRGQASSCLRRADGG